MNEVRSVKNVEWTCLHGSHVRQIAVAACGCERPPLATIHVLKTSCAEGEHDWSGPEYEHVHEGGSVESGATCATCGMEFGHWALFNL